MPPLHDGCLTRQRDVLVPIHLAHAEHAPVISELLNQLAARRSKRAFTKGRRRYFRTAYDNMLAHLFKGRLLPR